MKSPPKAGAEKFCISKMIIQIERASKVADKSKISEF